MRALSLPAKVEREKLLQTPLETLVEIILRQQEILEKQAEEIERLKNKAESDSSNSSKPPSSDLLKRSEKPLAATEEGTGKRKPGGQTGHEGKTRKGFGRVDRVVVVRPSNCPKCRGTTFEETPVKVRRYQVAELAERALEVVEYERQCCLCGTCGESVWGTLPVGVIGEQSLGAKLQSLLVWLGNYGHLSYEKQQELLRELGGIEIGTGTLTATNARSAAVVKIAVEKLGEWVQNCPHVQVDETPWLVLGVKEWMWVVCGIGFCLFHAKGYSFPSGARNLIGQEFSRSLKFR